MLPSFFHGGNAGSNPTGDAMILKHLQPRGNHAAMKAILWLLVVVPPVFLAGCSAMTSGGSCVVNASVTPSSAMADHTAPAPGDQVLFTTVVQQVSGACPQVVTAGSWTTSDPVNTAISNQSPSQGMATCLNATSSPATISYTGTAEGHSYTPAMLTCD